MVQTHASEYVKLLVVTAFVLALNIAQFFILSFYSLLPSSMDAIYRRSELVRHLFSYQLRGGKGSSNDQHKKHGLDPDCFRDSVELIQAMGYPVETHICRTQDGYYLVLHRIPHSPNVEKLGSEPRPAVLLMHGLMLTSECWLINKAKSLPYQLADAGYDVWLGNNRGNKYSCKHVHLDPANDDAYWNYSLDELAMFDLPCLVNYVCNTTGQSKIGYVGFSNGSAQAFAAFSCQKELENKISVFVALSPAVKVNGLKNSLASSLIHSNNNFIFLIFGTKMMLSIATFWQQVLSTPIYVRVIDFCLAFLFGWSTKLWHRDNKPLIYYHIFSFTSTKHVAHWFQIIRTDRFQMYDDLGQSAFAPPVYDIARVKVPIAVFYGGRDTIINSEALMKALPGPFLAHYEPDYEHLDFLWADDVAERVFPKVRLILQRVASSRSEKTVDLGSFDDL